MTFQSNAARGKFPGAGYKINPTAHRDPLAAAASRILDEVRNALPHDLDAASSSVARLAALLHDKTVSPLTHPALNKGCLAPWQENTVLRYIDSNIGSPIGNNDLAALLSLSLGHFCRAFTSSFSTTPHAYILRWRVQRAKEMMNENCLPLSQIALDCGFADQAHFCRVFRQLTGLTPSAWRRIWPKEASVGVFALDDVDTRRKVVEGFA